jgi:hypothetical protein
MPFPCRFAKGLDCVFSIWFTHCGRVWFTHSMPFSFRSAKDLDFVFPIWFTQCGCVFTHAIPFTCLFPVMPRICRSESDLLKTRHSAAWERHGMCELAVAVLRWHVGDLPAFGEWQNSGRTAAGSRQGRSRFAAGSRQNRGRIAAGERHDICKLAFNEACGRHGMCESGFTWRT